ncbi:group II intron reverse transcriptase/maturase [Hamadaea sp. NPDC051192]|uniref:group II intron reverse transcriptase/maturase n=1 Tax=Hamadaea sp. NPDC051192 TaxID=3154940 RepID=UPI003421D86D
MDKLDAEPSVVEVNGPDDIDLDWTAVSWRHAEADVQRLRQRIFTASKAGDLKKVRNLQKLMLRSRSNALVSVRRVTELNAGRKTPGVDGKVVVLPGVKADMANWVQRGCTSWRARPVKRVYIPKSNGKKRPLGIPVIADRALQAAAVNALEPEWEARFEPKSYGFRPGRGCHDAIEAVFAVARGKNAQKLWVLDADLTAAFDRINHEHLLASIGGFPARGIVAQWLRAGVMDEGRYAPTVEGSPQGGVISPLLLNVALHGMETAVGVRYHQTGRNAGAVRGPSPVLIRYADDLLVLCRSKEQVEQAKQQLAAWLEPRGLSFNEDKTRIVHLNDGCDFLGFTIRRHRGKLLTKPSKAAMRRARQRLTAEMRNLRGAQTAAVIAKLNPFIRGWAAYYRTGVSKEAFRSLDLHVWKLAYSWARHRHPKKSKGWIKQRYFGKFHPTRNDTWVFGDRDTGHYVLRFAWTKIVRHTLVRGTASPDDPTLSEYWAKRQRRRRVDTHVRLVMLQKQRGRCPICGDLLLLAANEPQHPTEWELWLRAVSHAMRKQWLGTAAPPGSPDDHAALFLVHTRCQTRWRADGTDLQQADEPLGLA